MKISGTTVRRGVDEMAMSKKYLEKREKDIKKELVDLEAKCKGGSGTKDDYVQLAKLKKKLG